MFYINNLKLVKRKERNNRLWLFLFVYLKSKLLYGRDYLIFEENFVALLDKYVGYVRNTYTIKHNELVIILEGTLKNMYNRSIYIKSDYHNSVDIFLSEFKRMFLENLVYNTHYYSKQDKEKEFYAI